MPDGQIGIPGEKGVLVVVAGRQRVGKTTVANALVQYFGGLGCRFEVWNADQQNRSHSLSSFFPDALTPPEGGMVDGRIWLEQRLKDLTRRRSNAVLDPGGGVGRRGHSCRGPVLCRRRARRPGLPRALCRGGPVYARFNDDRDECGA